MNLTFELTRPGDHAVAIPGVVTYSLRVGPGQTRSLELDWDVALLQDLYALRAGHADEEAQARLGERLRELLEPAGWRSLEQQLDAALAQGESVRLTVLAGAPELYALPWELLRLRGAGQPLFRVKGVQLRYAWPGVLGPPPELALGVQPHDPLTRVLFAWSEAGGAVPADAHRAALHEAWGAERVIELPHVTLDALEDALRTSAGEGHPIRLLHLLAHGGGREDQRRLHLSDPDPASPDALREALTPFVQALALVVLVACRGGQSSAPGALGVGLAEALHRGEAGHDGVTDVIAARAPLSVSGSIVLAGALHPALRRGLKVEEALDAARQALLRDHPLDACALQHLHPAEARSSAPPQRLRWARYTQLQKDLELLERELKEYEKRGESAPEELRVQRAALKEQMRACNTPQVGDRFAQGRYELITHLATGGFASVWKAWDKRQSRHVAMKLLKGRFIGDSDRRRRFFRGAERMAGLRAHPGVVQVVDQGDEEDGFCWFAMELVPGGTLREAVLAGRVAVPLRVILQLGEALSYAHAQGLVHRDVKPSNVLMDAAGRPKITDFDLVKAVDTEGGTQTRSGLGTVIFAAPEQGHAAGSVDVRADVYSLAVTALFVLDGRPLEGRGAWGPPRLLAELEQPEAVKAVLGRGAAYRPEERYGSVEAFCEGLRGAFFEVERATAERPAPIPASPPRPAPREEVAPAPIPTAVVDQPPARSSDFGPPQDHPARRSFGFIQKAVVVTLVLAGIAVLMWTMDSGPIGALTDPPTGALADPPTSGPSGQDIIALADSPNPMRLIGLRGGEFTMGSPEDEAGRYDDEGPQHRVKLSPFAICEAEVTQAQWRWVAESEPGQERDLDPAPSNFIGDTLPVESVSWCQVARWLNALSELEGLAPVYEDLKDCESGANVRWLSERDGYRLPTEAEWEYAARAGTRTPWSWGSDEGDADRYAWFGEGPSGTSHAAMSKAPNPWGLYDVHGNVYEWVWDWYAKYEVDSQNSGNGSTNAIYRLLRGGSFVLSPRGMRSADRARDDPRGRDWYLGFRCVRGPAPQH